jgi:hypothetical protein
MASRQLFFSGFVAILTVVAAGSARAGAGRVELTIVGEPQAAVDFHQWMAVLVRAGVSNVRFRNAGPADQVGIEIQGSSERPLYLVTGVLSSRGELVLPGGRFGRGDAGQIGQWLKDLAANGPPEQRETKSAFGLTAKQLQLVHDDLAQLVGFSTQGVARGEVVQRIGRRLHFSIEIDRRQQEALGRDPVVEQLSGLTCGTALACVLRPSGLGLAPRPSGPSVSYSIADARQAGQIWPIGWPAEKSPHDVLPSLYEFHNVNIQGVTAAKAISAIGQRLKAPLLMDHNAMARHGIDPEKVVVGFPASHTTYSLILQKVLFKAGLKEELRVDEAGNPFLWVTSVKPL